MNILPLLRINLLIQIPDPEVYILLGIHHSKPSIQVKIFSRKKIISFTNLYNFGTILLIFRDLLCKRIRHLKDFILTASLVSYNLG